MKETVRMHTTDIELIQSTHVCGNLAILHYGLFCAYSRTETYGLTHHVYSYVIEAKALIDTYADDYGDEFWSVY